MNAFKKELAGMLLDDSQEFRTMGNVITSMDEVFENYSKQRDPLDRMGMWITFISVFTYHLAGKIIESCIDETQTIDEDAKNLINLFVALEKVAVTEYEEMILFETNESYARYLNDIKEAVFK